MKNKVTAYIKNIFAILVNSLKIKSIQFTITTSFVLITILAMLFVGITLYNKFSNTAEQNASINTRQIIEQVHLNMDYYLKSMIQISNSAGNLLNADQDVPNYKLLDQMNVILNTREDIVTLAIFSNQGDLVIAAPFFRLKNKIDLTGQDWFKAAVEKPQELFFSSPHVQNLFEGQHNWVVSLSRQITFNAKGQKMNGVLLVDMNFRAIDQLCQMVSLGKKGYIYITDSNGNIVYHPQQQLIYLGLKNENNTEVVKYADGSYLEELSGEKRLITVKTVNYTGWKIVGISYMDEIVATKKEISNFVKWILFFGFFFVIFISALVSAKISQPVKRLEKSMKMVEEGNFDINIDVRGGDEVVELSRAFNLMIARIRYLMNQIVLEQEAKRKSELNALQAQINPHFLYNTLDSIVWMAENGKSQDVITMVTALAKLFRISISRGKNIITVQEELEHARNYLIIQKIRYKNKFKFEIEAQEEALRCKTLKLILQPIIENSIYHGIEYMVDEGFIKISAAIVDDRLLYEIRDNGLGMKPEVLEKILEYQPENRQGSGVGVKNVNERIQLCFGREYGLRIESELEAGTTVKIWLPLVKEE